VEFLDPKNPSPERKLYSGTLIGYRHFKIFDGKLVSPSYSTYEWSGGVNESYCMRPPKTTKEVNELLKRMSNLRDVNQILIRWRNGNPGALNELMEYVRDFEIFESTSGAMNVYVTLNDSYSYHWDEFEGAIKSIQELLDSRNPHALSGCRCGFYASYSPYHNFYRNWGAPSGWPWRERQDQVHGVVEFWGNVLLATKGFRATKARLLALAPMSPVHPIKFLGDRYPDVRIFAKDADLIQAYPEPDRSGLGIKAEGDYW
jgi:hypothetical protein